MSARNKARRLFRRLSAASGFVFAFAAGIILASVMVSSPSVVTESGVVAEASGAGGHAPVTIIVLWLLCTAMGFVIGWLVMRLIGWCVIGLLPHTTQPEYDNMSVEADANSPPSPANATDVEQPVATVRSAEANSPAVDDPAVPILNDVVGPAPCASKSHHADEAAVNEEAEHRHAPEEALIDRR